MQSSTTSTWQPPAYVAAQRDLEQALRDLHAGILTAGQLIRVDLAKDMDTAAVQAQADELVQNLAASLMYELGVLPKASGQDQLGIGESDFKDAICDRCGELIDGADEAEATDEDGETVLTVHASSCLDAQEPQDSN